MIFYDLWSLELSIDFALSHFCSSDIVYATKQNVGDTIFIGFGSKVTGIFRSYFVNLSRNISGVTSSDLWMIYISIRIQKQEFQHISDM